MLNPLASDSNRAPHFPSDACDLCGLPLRHRNITAEFFERSYSFCCFGCRQVFNILLESMDSADPKSFKETDLFKQCRERGIIPGSETDLASKALAIEPQNSSLVATVRPDGTFAESSEDILSVNLKVGNMWCPSCAWLIEEILKKTSGVIDSSCNFFTDRIYIHFNPIQTSPAQIIRTIGKLGYNTAVPEDSRDAGQGRKEFLRFAISAVLTMNIMLMSYALYSGFFTELTRNTVHKLSLPAFIMATIVLTYGGFDFFKKAWSGLTHAAFSMETLIIIGALSAYLYSSINLFTGSIHLYYDTASMLITLVLLGKTLERRAKSRVLEGLEHFFSLKPTKVRICTDRFPQGRFVAIEQLAEGDRFHVEENEISPADGRIVSGGGAVDESSLTGEALPIIKKPGDILQSGSRIISGTLKVRADKVGDDSTLGQMMNIIQKALMTKAPLEGKTDTILQWFVPVVIALSAGTAFICLLAGLTTEESMLRAITVLVISCPCALGLAIPLARVAGISIAGAKGILVRDFAAFERAEKINAFVFDKTGTVTIGQWNLLDIIPVGPITADETLALAAGLEREADHFIATEILIQAHKKNIEPVKVEVIKIEAKGITGEVEGKKIKIGSADFLAQELEDTDSLEKTRLFNEQTKHSLVYLGVDGKLGAVFIFGDRLREKILPTVQELKERGYRLVLVSGDGIQITRTIGDKIKIQESYGGKLPQEKAAFVRELQKQGARVAMVGDGINDAPALVAADLSIAVRSVGQLGKETADITIMRSDPVQILDFLKMAEKVNKKIYQNLIYAFIYNILSIPIAMSGLLSPLVAVCAMLFSSLSIIGNTFLLIRKMT